VRRAVALLWAALLTGAGGCLAAETESEGEAESGVLACEDAPVDTWETFGRGFLTTHCNGCHAATTLDRRGAPEDLVFDSEDDALAHKAALLSSAGHAEPRMPPTGGTTEQERLRLRIWLSCFAD